jgi:hypothetical protein
LNQPAKRGTSNDTYDEQSVVKKRVVTYERTEEDKQRLQKAPWYKMLNENLTDKVNIEGDVKYNRLAYVLDAQGMKMKYNAEATPCNKCKEGNFCPIKHCMQQCDDCHKFGHPTKFCHQRKTTK